MVDVWWMSVEAPLHDIASLMTILSPDEVAKAYRFRRLVDLRRFVVCRAMLRRILSTYVGVSPSRIEFDTMCRHCGGAHGKPLLGGVSERGLDFSVSHSGAVAAVAVGPAQIGIDVEQLRDDLDWTTLACQILTDEEANELYALPDVTRARATLAWWTCKEAFTKATAHGLVIPLKAFAVSSPLVAPQLQYAAHEDVSAWSMRHLDIGDEYLGTVAVRSTNVIVRNLRTEELDAVAAVSRRTPARA